MVLRLLSLCLSLLLAGTDARAADIAVEQPWARATPGRAPTGAVYLTLANRGKDSDRLIGATSPAAGRAELHSHEANDTGHAGHMAEMRPVAEIEVKPGGRVSLKPGAFHVMLIGLKAPLKEGDHFPLTLRFARAGEMTVDVPVGRAGAMGPPK